MGREKDIQLPFDPARVIKKALESGGQFADIFVESSTPCSIVCDDGKLEKVIQGRDSGAGVRVIYRGRASYAYTNDLSLKSLLDLAELVGKSVMDGGSPPAIPVMTRHPVVSLSVLRRPEEVKLEEKVAAVMKANDAAWKASDKVRQVTVSYRDRVQSVVVFNSDGAHVTDERLSTLLVVQVVAADGDRVQTGYEPRGGSMGFELIEEELPEEIAMTAAARALMMLYARPAPAGKMPVVLSAEAGGTMIHEAVGHGLEADLAQQGLSVYSGRKGEQIASLLVSVVDDATLSRKRGSFCYDDEGVPAQRKVLIEKGVLRSFMYDRLTAFKDGALSTGNGRRESYRFRPIPRMTNTFILPGQGSPEEIIKATPTGILVKKMGGGQVNTVTGDFVFEISEGYLIENGQVGDPIRGATLTGNGPQVLNEIDLVGNDLGFGIGTCGKDGQGVPVADAQPTLRIPEIIVGGL